MKKTKWVLGLSLVGILAISGTAYAFGPGVPAATGQIPQSIGSAQNQGSITQTGYGYGMMGGYTDTNRSSNYSGYGGGCGGFNKGTGYGMMSGGYNAASLGINLANGQITSDDQVLSIAKAYVQVLKQDLSISEIHEYNDSYEVELKNSKTGSNAFEFLIGKNGGYISAEMGPNTMWNTQYGHMNRGNNGAPGTFGVPSAPSAPDALGAPGTPGTLTVTAEQAAKAAQDFVSQQMGSGYSVEQPEAAPGYYEFMILKDNKDYAELDVNGYTGQLWFENWHGPIVKTIETK